MNTFRISNRLLTLCLGLGLALLCLGSRAWLPDHSAAMAPPVLDGLPPEEWQAIQSQIAKLIAGDGAEADVFGTSVSVNGDTAVVGAIYADIDGNENQGAAYVFSRNQGGTNAWGQVTKLSAPGTAWDCFGWSVSVSGDTIVVGSPWADVGSNGDQGAAYVFYRNQGGTDAWGQVAKLTAADGAAWSGFGWSVALSGDIAVIGSNADVYPNLRQGAAYVFYRHQGGTDKWGQVAKLTAADGATQDYFSYSVSVSGDRIVIGAYLADVGDNENQGAAYIFYRDQGGANAWGQVAKLTAADGAMQDFFGSSVAISNDMAFIGARSADGDSEVDQGAVYVFYRNQGGTDAWEQLFKLTAADGTENDLFGNSLSVDGETVVVGAQYADIDGNENQGAAYVFHRNVGGVDAWGQVDKLVASDGIARDIFGRSVAISGSTMIVGASSADINGSVNQGAAYIFQSEACVPLTDVSLVGPIGITTTLYIGTAYHFQAVITPVNATPPITYTWTPTPATGQGTTDAVYRWMTPGTYTTTLTAENCPAPSTVVTATKQVVIEWRELHFIYLPLVQKK